MGKDKSEKKKKEKKTAAEGGEDVEMQDVAVGRPVLYSFIEEFTKSVAFQAVETEDKSEIVVPISELSPIAHPLAQKKLAKKIHKTIKKGESLKMLITELL
jgi:H/ACA ribonucleoprotein complex subunit 2